MVFEKGRGGDVACRGAEYGYVGGGDYKADAAVE